MFLKSTHDSSNLSENICLILKKETKLPIKICKCYIGTDVHVFKSRCDIKPAIYFITEAFNFN